MRIRPALGLILGVLSAVPAFAQDAPREEPPAVAGPDKPSEPGDAQKSVCLLLESAARANGLPVEFFARVIWQESRFRSDAVGPVTRSGKRALGIAQFMPGTAAERNLLNPLDPIQALPKSAEFLHELRREFGNLGLAAAAYNAGPRRIREWMNGSGAMPSETRNYVLAITGAPVEQWSKAGPDADGKQEQGLGCGELMALLRRAPSRFVAALEQRIVAGVVQPWGVILGADMSRPRMLSKYAELQQRHAAVLAGRDLSCLSAAAVRCRVIRSGSALKRVRTRMRFALAFTRVAATVSCCAILAPDGPHTSHGVLANSSKQSSASVQRTAARSQSPACSRLAAE